MISNDRQFATGTDGIDRRTLPNGAVVAGGATLAGALVPETAQAAPLPEDGELVRFSIIIDESEVAAFGELSGLVTEIDPNECLRSGRRRST